ncbi:hypothetical protein LSH36_498g00072 [Paralvinella palmiformis]|uniref:Sodium-coupled monocarboxylate transporter 1 n=1 Tax=Paralvinella palmiformis TaxID=53620 RepID=A0AAD9J8I3_9ANNE|nr:hypothetical protein LSH36_498g00072 [Paralvinella palmiformis]
MESKEVCNFVPGLIGRPTTSYHWADYFVFALTLSVSAIVGLYYGIKTRHNMSVREMLLGGKDMNLYSVAFSLVATVTSTIFVLGVPSRTFYSRQWPLYVALSFIPATVITVHVFIPIFHKLGVTSAYEYLGIRFNGIVRFMTAIDFLAMMNLTQALTIYTPAVSFSLVAGVPLEVSILTAGLVCTFYTALGGLRAVVVTDIFQICTVLIGILGLFIKGAIDAGGIDKVFSQIMSSQRLQLWSIQWTNDGTYTLWSQVLGGTVIFLGLFASNQTTVQRYCSVKKCRDAQKAAYVALIFYVIIWVLVLLVGLVIYSFYYTCDPLVLQIISSPDEILPLFVMDALGHLHGLPGLFSAAVFGAVLSSVSSGINSMSAVTLEDIIKPIYHRTKKRELSEYYCRALTRTLGKGREWAVCESDRVPTRSGDPALFYGMMSIALSYIPVKYGTYILNLDMTFSAYGVLGGPIIGVFILGIIFPVANSMGTGIGLVVGTLFGIWMWIGRLLCMNSSHIPLKLQSPSECYKYCNMTVVDPVNKTSYQGFPINKLYIDCPLQPMYDVSYLWYGTIGSFVTIALGLLVSMVSGAHGAKRVSPDLLCWPNLKRSLERICLRCKKNKRFTPTTEPTLPDYLQSEVKTASSKENVSPEQQQQPPNGLLPPKEPIIMLKSDGTYLPDSTGSATHRPAGPIPCYVEDNASYSDNSEHVLYQDDDGPMPNGGGGGLFFDQIQNVDDVHFRDGRINDGYATEAVDDDGVRVLYQPDNDDHVIVGDPLVLRPDALAPTTGVLYQSELPAPGEYAIQNAVYPDHAVLYDGGNHYENPVLHPNSEAADSQLTQRSIRPNIPTLW